MDNLRLRAILLNLQDRLSNDDRKRLHFYFGNDIPRRIRDDPSLGGTLNLMDSLFDQDKINDEDFTYLINAFDQIRCLDAVKLLKEHLNRKSTFGLNQSMQSLSVIMPPILDKLLQDADEDDDGQQMVSSSLVNKQNPRDTNILEQRKDSSLIIKRKSLFRKCIFAFIFFLIIVSLISFSFWNYMSIGQLKLKHIEVNKMIQEIQISQNNHLNLVKQLQNQSIMMMINKKSKFKLHAKIVAGGNKHGDELNQLSGPDGIFIDEEKTMFITDYYNHSIIKWKYNEKKGEIIAGGNGNGTRLDQLYCPTDTIVDEESSSIIIADRWNNRVIRWFDRRQQEILIDNIVCYGLTMDSQGFLYVSDTDKNEVKRWKIGDKQMLVAGGNGKGNQLNQLNGPTHIFVDEDYSLYVSDGGNHRVMKWQKNASEGIVVAGGNGQGGNLNQLFYPSGLVVDRWGQIYIADCYNHRIMRWSEGDKEGEIVVGGNGKGNGLNQLNTPRGLTFDLNGNLYVADSWNSRIVRFDLL